MRGRIVRIGIALGIILAAAPLKPALAGGGGCIERDLNVAREDAVVLHNMCFTPTIARVPVGTTVAWHNKDPLKHTMTGANLTFGDLDEKGLGAVWRVKFDRAGVYPYYCFLHPGMVGTIVVGNDAQLVTALGRTGLEFPENVTDAVVKTPVKAATTKKESSSAWPATAAGIGVASVGLGFGFGRRGRRNGHAPAA
jgi:plastocyanin